MRTRHRYTWLLFGLLMCGCIYPQKPPLTLEAGSSVFRGTVPNGADDAPMLRDVITDRPAVIVFHSDRWNAWETTRSANSLRRLADQLRAHTDFLVVEVVISNTPGENGHHPFGTSQRRPSNWIRIDAHTDDPIAAPLAEYYGDFAAYFAMPGESPVRVATSYFDERAMGPLADRAMGFPAATNDQEWAHGAFVRRFGGVADLQENDGNTITARYHNPATKHDVVARFVREGDRVFPASDGNAHERTYAEPGTICVNGMGAYMELRELASIAPEVVDGLDGATPGTLVYLASIHLRDEEYDARHRNWNSYSARRAPAMDCIDVPPGTYRLELGVRRLDGTSGTTLLSTIVVQVGPNEGRSVDVVDTIRRAIEP